LDTVEKLKTIVRTAVDKKAENPVIIHIGALSSFTDYFVILTANSDIHARTIVDEIRKRLKEKGVSPVSVEGYENASWILLDYGDVIVHVFRPEVRELYALEHLWMDAPRVEVEELLQEEKV